MSLLASVLNLAASSLQSVKFGTAKDTAPSVSQVGSSCRTLFPLASFACLVELNGHRNAWVAFALRVDAGMCIIE